MAIILNPLEGGSSESLHNHLGGYYIQAAVAHNLAIIGWHRYLVGNFVFCWIENGGKTEKCLDKAAVRRVTILQWQIELIGLFRKWTVFASGSSRNITQYYEIVVGALLGA